MTVIFVSLGFTAGYAQEDVEGSKDHPMISRYEGSYIKGYEHYDYNRLVFGYKTDDGEKEEITAKGEVTRIGYAAPIGLSSLQVHRNYLTALKNAGFEILFNCIDEGEKCHGWFRNYDINIDGTKDFFHGKDYYYFLAKLSDSEGDVYVSAHTVLMRYNHPATALQIVEEKPMETGKVKVNIDAETMANDIDDKGSVRIYGIHFDTDKATIKEKSESTLTEIATLLEQKPDLKLHVVGHTDATGGLEHNMELSKQRAEAAVEYLTSEHGVSEDRLTPYGVGPLAPVAGNDDEDGRARNRRVELVKVMENK
ncbi:MAG: OmpA family protein [Bacteroidales bacterium]